jgi:hypothetical protein
LRRLHSVQASVIATLTPVAMCVLSSVVYVSR